MKDAEATIRSAILDAIISEGVPIPPTMARAVDTIYKSIVHEDVRWALRLVANIQCFETDVVEQCEDYPFFIQCSCSSDFRPKVGDMKCPNCGRKYKICWMGAREYVIEEVISLSNR